MEALRKKSVAATTTLAGRAIERLVEKARLPEFRRDPAFTDVYVRYDALDTLISLRKEISTATIEHLRSGFDSAEATVDPSTGEFEMPMIIDTQSEELEQWTRPLAERLQKAHEKELGSIAGGLGRLSLLTRVTNPLAAHPDALLRAFQNSISPLALDVRGKQLLCELYCQELEPELGGFYQRLRGLLDSVPQVDKSKNVHTDKAPATPTLPVVESAPPIAKKSQPESASRIARAGEDEGFLPLLDTPGAKPERGITDEDVLDIVVQSTSPGKGSRLSVYQRQQIADALSVIQRQAEQPDTDQIKSRISKVLYDGGAFDAGDLIRKEGPVIDFASQIFKEVLTSDRIGKRLRKLIGKLQVPVIKLAVLNFGVFKDPGDPTRQFLSVLLDMAVYASYREEAFTEKLEEIVNTLISRTDAGPDEFAKSLKQLRALEVRIDAVKKTVTEDPTREVESLSLRMAHAQQTVDVLIAKNAGHWETPRWVGTFATEVWAPYMVRMLAERGEYSAEWKEALYIYHQLLVTSRPGNLDRPEQTLDQLNALIGPVDLFFGGLVTRLEAVPPVTGDWRQRLEAAKRWYKGLHYRLVDTTLDIDHVPSRGEREKRSARPCLPRTGTRPAASTGSGYDAPKPREHKARSLPSSVKAGMWFEIYRGPDRGKRRLKLSTTRNLENGVRFENRSGHEELSIDPDTFLDDLLAGRTLPISDSNVFDQALSHVIANIRTTQKPKP
ncbi:MAG: DUF1631 family protein [Pseudomonadota bacterium]|nr:DUF1631 family protein [Pseudomonadota bacterium]